MATRKLPPGIRQLKSGRYQARHTGPDGLRRSAPVTFTTITDARGWLDEQDRAVRMGRWRDPNAGGERFADYAETWLAARKLTPRTRAEYRKILNSHLLPTFGPQRLDRITPAAVRRWHGELGQRTGPTRQAHAYLLLHAVFATAVADDIVSTNPCRVRGAGNTARARDPKPATLAELEVIVAEMPDRYRAAILLAAWCALRHGELAELRRGDIDLSAGVVHVRRGVTYVDGRPVVGPPKTRAGIRDVAIPPHLGPMLEAHLAEHVGVGADALLFPAPESGRQLRSDGALHRAFHAARVKAGRPDLKLHHLRHTGATLAAATGATLAELMARLGHSTPTAALMYQHTAADRDRAIADALSGFASAKVVELRPRRSAS